jgi:hypothetical protein
MMDNEKLKSWIEKLNKADKKDHEKIVNAMAKENTLKVEDAWKLLELAGFKTKDDKQTGAGSIKRTVVLRHKTEYPKYRRAGLVLTQKAEIYEVTDEQLAMLKKDSWVDVNEDEKDGAGK